LFKKAVIKRGKTTAIYSDNGSIYRSKQWQSVLRGTIGLGASLPKKIGHLGREKLNGTISRYSEVSTKRLSMRVYQTLEELNEFFWAWLDEPISQRKHMSTLNQDATSALAGGGAED